MYNIIILIYYISLHLNLSYFNIIITYIYSIIIYLYIYIICNILYLLLKFVTPFALRARMRKNIRGDEHLYQFFGRNIRAKAIIRTHS